MAFSFFKGLFRKKRSQAERVAELSHMHDFLDHAEALAGIKRPSGKRSFFIILIEGDMMKIVHQLIKEFPGFNEGAEAMIQQNSRGAVIVTVDDPSEVISRYKSSGLKFVVANNGKPYANPQNRSSASRIVSDLIIFNEYNRMCHENGMRGGDL